MRAKVIWFASVKPCRFVAVVLAGFIFAIAGFLSLTMLPIMAYNPGGITGIISVGTSEGLPLMVATTSPAGPLIVLARGWWFDEAKLDDYDITSVYEILTNEPTSPSEMYGELDVSNIPGGQAANEMLAAGDAPQAAWWFPFVVLGICVLGLIVYGATTLQRTRNGRLREGQIDGSLLVMFIMMEIPLAVFGIMEIIPLFAAFLFPIAGAAIIMSRKHFSWG